MRAVGRRGVIRSPTALKTTAKSVNLALTMEGPVEVKTGENGTDYAICIGVGMDGARVQVSFFQEAIGLAEASLKDGSSCSGVIDFLWGRIDGSGHRVFPRVQRFGELLGE